MATLVIKRAALFFGVMVALLFLFPGIPILAAILVPPEDVLVLVDGSASADAWLDANGDGKRDSDEAPMAGVCVWDDLIRPELPSEAELSSICEYSLTDDLGHWPESGNPALEFRAGADCDDILIFVKPPDGYKATTLLVVNGCHAVFGLTPSSESMTASDYIREYKRHYSSGDTMERLYTIGRVAIVLGEVLLAALLTVRLVRPRAEA